MKKLFYHSAIGVGLLIMMASCEKTFLQKPDTSGTTTITTVFSTTVDADAAIAAAYRSALVQGLPYSGLGHGTTSSIGGERSRGYNWHATYAIVGSGLNPNPLDGYSAASSDDYATNYSVIRQCFIIMENIDNVSDMDATTKGYVKAEMYGLIAYRYMGMMIRYGGVPIVTKSFQPTDSLNIPRATLQNTFNYTISLCDSAIAGLPDSWSSTFAGRLTKGVAMAIKLKAQTYAARPLFNSQSPYLDFGNNNNLVCFGSADNSRWNDAITTGEALLTWASQNGYAIINTGGAGVGQPNPNALADYGNATSTPNNKEVLLAYKVDETGDGIPKWYNLTYYYDNIYGDGYDCDLVGMLSNFLPNYYTAAGTDQDWPQVGDPARPYSDYQSRILSMEPRMLCDNIFPGINAANNPGIYYWTCAGWRHGLINQNGGYGAGDAQPTKFYYMAGSRVWMEYPLFRMAEVYLNLAEAYNEVGNTALALQDLNVVHNRAGLPSITATGQTQLRTAIQREWAVEYYDELHRYFDVKHWKLANIGNGIIGGATHEFQFIPVPGASNYNIASGLASYYDAVVFQTYWSPKMFLEPFPQSEVNKGIIIQNPGY
jgi:hypothetical protein